MAIRSVHATSVRATSVMHNFSSSLTKLNCVEREGFDTLASSHCRPQQFYVRH